MELWSQLKPSDPPFAHVPYVAGCQTDVEHDAAYAHALVRAMEEYDWYQWERHENAVAIVKHRAAELMREWGFEEKVTP